MTLILYKSWREWLLRLVRRGTLDVRDDLDISRVARLAAICGIPPRSRRGRRFIDDFYDEKRCSVGIPPYPYMPCFDCSHIMLFGRIICPHCGADQRDDIPF